MEINNRLNQENELTFLDHCHYWQLPVLLSVAEVITLTVELELGSSITLQKNNNTWLKVCFNVSVYSDPLKS